MAKAATRKAEELGLVAAAKKKQTEEHGDRVHLVDESPASRPTRATRPSSCALLRCFAAEEALTGRIVGARP
jgi:hypothetical protein